jgi:hypothetical protein
MEAGSFTKNQGITIDQYGAIPQMVSIVGTATCSHNKWHIYSETGKKNLSNWRSKMKNLEHKLQEVYYRLITQKLIKTKATVEKNRHFTPSLQSLCCFTFIYINNHLCSKYSCAFSEIDGLVHSKSVTIVLCIVYDYILLRLLPTMNILGINQPKY